MTMLAIFGLPGGMEWIFLLIIGLLLFGRRLPEVGRSLGRSIVEFKKGIKGIEDEIEGEVDASTRPRQVSQPGSSPQIAGEGAGGSGGASMPTSGEQRTVSRSDNPDLG